MKVAGFRSEEGSVASELRIEYILLMPSTTVHFPRDVLDRIDAAARRRGVSRNRFVMAACERALDLDDGEWPEDFFHDRLTPDERKLLDGGTRELERAIRANRRTRGAPAL